MVHGYALLLCVAPAVVAVDQATKHLAVRALQGKSGVDVIRGHFRFTYVENTGAAWSLFADAPAAVRVPLFVAVSLLAMSFILYFYRQLAPGQRMLRTALALILGGAAGNFVDRLRQGYVVDFVAWSWRETQWPRFNVADAAISAGVVLMVWALVAGERRARAGAAPAGQG